MSAESTLTEVQRDALERFNALPTWDAPRMVPLDSLEFTTWNVNEMTDSEFSELVIEIEDGGYTTDDGQHIPGFDEPVGLIPIPNEAGKWLVPSGEHRVRAALSLNMDAIPAVLKVHLSDADEAEVKMWSVKRNHIRGRVNAQKYAALERSLSERHNIRADAARQRMLVKGELLKGLRKNRVVLDNEPRGGPPSRGGMGSRAGATPSSPPDGESAGVEPGALSPSAPVPPAGRTGSETDSGRDTKQEDADRAKLQRGFKAAWEEALVNSAHTVEHGYLVLADGKDGGKCHVIVDTPAQLANLTKRMVAACQGESAKVSEFLASAIAVELRTWEER